MPDPDRQGTIDSAEEFITRRKMMAASSAMMAGGLAGCSSSDGGGGGGGGGGGEEVTITTFHERIPGELNFNSYAPSYPWTASWLLLEPILRYFADGSIKFNMVEDWSYDEDTQQEAVHFNEDYYWWNGDVANAADKYWYEEFNRLSNPEASSYEQLILENNGQTIVREHKEPQNPQLVEYGLGGYLGAMHRVHRDKFRPWAEEMADATTEDERVDIEERMAEEMPLNIDTVIEEGLGLGAFEMVDYDDQGIYCEKFDQHPFADQINIDKLDYVLASDEAIAQQIMGGDLDFGFSTLPNWIGDQDPDHVETIAPYSDTFMRKLEFLEQGPGSKHMRQVEFRRALAHIISREHVSANYAPESTPRTLQTGLPEQVTEEWLGDYVDDFLDYPVGEDEDGATELLESIGYEREGDIWVDDNGEEITLELVLPNWAQNPARTVADQLSQFGFDIEMSVLEGAAYNDRTADSIDFDITMGSHGSLVAHPINYFRPVHSHGNDLGDAGPIEQSLENGEERSPYNGKELVVEIPEEVGQRDISGSTQEVNLYELHREWLTAQSDERNQEIAETFTWFWNYYVPGIDLLEVINGSWGNENWEYEVNDDWEAYRGAYRAVKRGLIAPK